MQNYNILYLAIKIVILWWHFLWKTFIPLIAYDFADTLRISSYKEKKTFDIYWYPTKAYLPAQFAANFTAMILNY